MHIHVSKKMLETTEFSIERTGDNIKIKGYRAGDIEVCEKCSLKTFESNESINVKNLKEKVCSCKPIVSPLLSFKVDAKKNKKITLV